MLKPSSENIITDMKTKRRRDWLDDLFEYERTHEIAFASPRALLEARMIAEMDKDRRPHRRARRNGVVKRRKLVAG